MFESAGTKLIILDEFASKDLSILGNSSSKILTN